MRLQLHLRRETTRTLVAGVGFVGARVSLDVLREIVFEARFVGTIRASEWFFSGVSANVVIVADLGDGAITTVRTHQRLLPAVYVHVPLQAKLVLGTEGAFRAGEALLHVTLIAKLVRSMGEHVVFQLFLQRETFTAKAAVKTLGVVTGARLALCGHRSITAITHLFEGLLK